MGCHIRVRTNPRRGAGGPGTVGHRVRAVRVRVETRTKTRRDDDSVGGLGLGLERPLHDGRHKETRAGVQTVLSVFDEDPETPKPVYLFFLGYLPV